MKCILVAWLFVATKSRDVAKTQRECAECGVIMKRVLLRLVAVDSGVPQSSKCDRSQLPQQAVLGGRGQSVKEGTEC